MEEYSEGKIHKSEPEPGNGNVNTVYFVNQARGNKRVGISQVEVYKRVGISLVPRPIPAIQNPNEKRKPGTERDSLGDSPRRVLPTSFTVTSR